MLLTGSMAMPTLGQETQLDISSGFNWDIWCGVKEFQALMYHAMNYWGIDLCELQSGVNMAAADTTHNGPSYLLGNSYWQICNVDAALAEAMNLPKDPQDRFLGYAGPTSWWRPGYKTGTQGTPDNGILTGADRTYHIASHAGNTTLPGDWTEVADCTTWTAGGIVSGTGLGLKFNLMANFTRHDSAALNDVSVTAELPEAQKGKYLNVNFVVGVYDGGNGGRHKRIWALYGEGGTDEQLLFAWEDSVADLRPQVDGAGGPFAGFSPVYTASERYSVTAGATGGVSTGNNTMYEFSAPLPLDKTKILWGFKIDDSQPTVNWQARGAAIWAATAFAVSDEVGRTDPMLSTIDVDPYRIPDTEDDPAIVTITLMDANQTPVVDLLEEAIDIAVSGDGTSTITFVGEVEDGVYVYEFTNDTKGVKELTVSVDDASPEDPIVLCGIGIVEVFNSGDLPVANAGPDQAVVDTDSSGDEEVLLDGSASTDANGTIVSYVWNWFGTQVAEGQTATALLDQGAWKIDLVVTDDEGYTGTDSLWVEVRAENSDLTLTQLDISSGFNVDALWGTYEMKALFLYANVNTPDLGGVEAQGYGSNANRLRVNPDIGWIVWSRYLNGTAATVNNTRDTYTTYLQWWHPAYIDGTEGLPESGYVAGAVADYYLASSSGNPVMPGNMVDAADEVTLAAQLGPAGWDKLTSQGMDIIFNTMAVGTTDDTTLWQKTTAYAELPVAQQAMYPNLNCALAAFDAARTHRGRYMRLAAVYTDDTEEIIWAWKDNVDPDDPDDDDNTPYPFELAIDNPDYAMLIQNTTYYGGGSAGTPGGMTVANLAIYEFAAPLTLNAEKTLKGLRLYDSNPTVMYQQRGIAIFAATAGEIGEGWGPPDVSVATEDGLDWVYENIPASLERGGHRVGLTVTVNDLNGNDSVSVALQKKAGSGPGEVVFQDGATDLEKLILGSDRNKAAPTAGALVIEVICTGNKAAEPTVLEVPFTCRLLGDLDGNGGAEPTDMSLLINKLNGTDTSGFHAYAFDLDKNGGAEPTDLSILINILNGVL